MPARRTRKLGHGNFARTVLGSLFDAPIDLLLAVRTYLDEVGNVSRTAERLVTHRNTVVRRLARADGLPQRPLPSRRWTSPRR